MSFNAANVNPENPFTDPNDVAVISSSYIATLSQWEE